MSNDVQPTNESTKIQFKSVDNNEFIITNFEKSLINLVNLPFTYNGNDELILKPSNDAVILNCGCVITESLVNELMVTNIGKFKCPLCLSTTKVLKINEELRKLYHILKEKGLIFDNNNNFKDQQSNRNKKQTLLSLFYSVAKNLDDEEEIDDSVSQNDRISETSSSAISFHSSSKQQYNHHQQEVSNSSITHDSKQPQSTSLVTTTNTSTKESPSTISLSLLSKFPSNTLNSTINSNRRFSNSFSNNNSLSVNSEHKEYLFVKCFPMCRAHYQHQTHSKLFKTKSKIFSNVSISPNCKFFVLLSSKKWEVFKIDSKNFKKPPILYCCGLSNGNYGKSFEKLINEIASKDEIKGGGFSLVNDPNSFEFKKKINDWEFLYCALSDSLLTISGTNGILRVFDLNQFGKPIYTYCSSFPIRCIDISPNSKLIAYGITGKDRISGSEQALIVMHSLNFNDSNNNNSNNNNNFTNDDSNDDNSTNGLSDEDFEFNLLGSLKSVDPITITFPYHDPINHITFSNDSNYLSCSTALESRFLTVVVKDPTRPKLVMKAIRTLDTSLESEGITSFKMFPNNKYMVVSSVAFNAPPIIIDNNIRSITSSSLLQTTMHSNNSSSNVSTAQTTGAGTNIIDQDSSSEMTKPLNVTKLSSSSVPTKSKSTNTTSGFQRVAQPKLLQRIDEVGNNIHKVAISPRNDSIALLDKNGTVYLMFATKMDDPSSKRLVVVDQVSNSFRVRESASLSFSKDGHQLFIVDRKGVLYINDFSAGLPSSPEITKCKLVVSHT